MQMDEALLGEVAGGDPEAAAFLRGMCQVAHFFDDVVDQDREITRGEAYAALWVAMVGLPRNGFYRQHFADLSPLVAVAITNWRAANTMEADGADAVSFVVRSSYADLFAMVALLTGGPDRAAALAVRVRRWVHSEGFAAYEAEMSNG